jgi:hypothetical protein
LERASVLSSYSRFFIKLQPWPIAVCEVKFLAYWSERRYCQVIVDSSSSFSHGRVL